MGLAFSPDGQRLASLGERDDVRVWDVATGRRVKRLPSNGAFALAYSKEGHLLLLRVSGGDVIWQDLDGRRELFRGPHGLGRTDTCRGAIQPAAPAIMFTDGSVGPRVVREGRVADMSGDKHWMRSVALSADAAHVAAADAEGFVRTWRAPDGGPVSEAKRHESDAWSVAFSPDGRMLASGSDKGIWITDVDGTERRRIPAEASVRALAFSPDGRTLAAGCGEEVRLFEAETGKAVRTLAGHADTVLCLAFSPDGKRLASGGYDCTVRLWDVESGAEIVERSGHQGRVTSLALSADGKRLATSSVDRTARIWDLATRRQLFVLRDSADVERVLFGPDGKTVLSQGSAIRCWDVETGQPLQSKVSEEEALRADALWLSPDGARLAGVHQPHILPGAGTFFVWDVPTGRRLLRYSWSSRLQLSAVFSPVGGILATSEGDDKIQFWDATRGGRPEREIRLEGHWIHDLAFSPDGTAMAVASHGDRREPRVRLIDPQTGAPFMTLVAAFKSPCSFPIRQ